MTALRWLAANVVPVLAVWCLVSLVAAVLFSGFMRGVTKE